MGQEAAELPMTSRAPTKSLPANQLDMWGLGLTYPSLDNINQQQEGVKLDKREHFPVDDSA